MRTVSRFTFRVSRFLVLGLLLAALSFATAVAQEHKAEPAKGAAAGQQAASAQTGPGEQLAHASREAAGEEEGTAAFKKSSSVQWLARHLGLSTEGGYWLAFALNFAVLALLIVFALKKNLPSMFRTRTETIQRAMIEARKASEEANARLSQIEERLKRLDTEVAAMRSAAEQEAAAEEQRIMAAAEEDKRRIVQAAEAEIAATTKLARRELRGYAADLAVGLAEQRLHVDTATDQALVRTFVDQLGSADGAGKDGQ